MWYRRLSVLLILLMSIFLVGCSEGHNNVAESSVNDLELISLVFDKFDIENHYSKSRIIHVIDGYPYEEI